MESNFFVSVIVQYALLTGDVDKILRTVIPIAAFRKQDVPQ